MDECAAEAARKEVQLAVKLRERWGRAPRDRLSGAGPKPLQAAAVKSRGGERWGELKEHLEQVNIRETNESEPFEDALVKSFSVVKTRGVVHLWDKSVRCLMTGQTATGVEGA